MERKNPGAPFGATEASEFVGRELLKSTPNTYFPQEIQHLNRSNSQHRAANWIVQRLVQRHGISTAHAIVISDLSGIGGSCGND